jgi:hypothetical protein
VVDDDDLPPLPVNGQPGVALEEYRLTSGTIRVKYESDSSNMGGSCTTKGSGTFSMAALPAAALKNFDLWIYSNGTYKLKLSTAANILALETISTCNLAGGHSITTHGREGGTVISLAFGTTGQLDVRATGMSWVVAGTSDTRVPPPGTYSGHWTFTGSMQHQ